MIHLSAQGIVLSVRGKWNARNSKNISYNYSSSLEWFQNWEGEKRLKMYQRPCMKKIHITARISSTRKETWRNVPLINLTNRNFCLLIVFSCCEITHLGRSSTLFMRESDFSSLLDLTKNKFIPKRNCFRIPTHRLCTDNRTAFWKIGFKFLSNNHCWLARNRSRYVLAFRFCSDKSAKISEFPWLLFHYRC